jgi:hypothetical protein
MMPLGAQAASAASTTWRAIGPPSSNVVRFAARSVARTRLAVQCLDERRGQRCRLLVGHHQELVRQQP